jgi:hypothetical protein
VCCTTNCVCSVPLNLLGLAEIYHGDFSLLVYHEVGCLYISVNVAGFVKTIQNQANLADNQSSEFFIEFTRHLQEFVKWKSLNKLQKHVNILGILKSAYDFIDPAVA